MMQIFISKFDNTGIDFYPDFINVDKFIIKFNYFFCLSYLCFMGEDYDD